MEKASRISSLESIIPHNQMRKLMKQRESDLQNSS